MKFQRFESVQVRKCSCDKEFCKNAVSKEFKGFGVWNAGMLE